MEIFRRLRLNVLIFFAIHLACLASAAIAADFEMSLQVKSVQQKLSAKVTEEQPSAMKPQPRATFTTKPNESLLISWKAIDSAKKASFQDVMIHFLVVAQKGPGQAYAPSSDDAVQESALTMDFKPGDSAKGECSLKLDKPGVYLLRIETRGMLEKYGHEYYAELDLVCK